MAKPTGTSGYFQAQLRVDGKVVGSFEAIPFSKEKVEVEKYMVERFIASMNKHLETRDIYLLLYVTHWSFALSDIVIACLPYWLRVQSTVFRAVFTYEPIDAEEGAPHWLFPVPPELIGSFDPEQVRENLCLNLNPRNFQVVHERKP